MELDILADTAREALLSLLPYSKAELKALFEQNHLGDVWLLLRDYVFSSQVWLMGVLPCLVLERFFSLGRRRGWLTPNLLVDLSFPIFGVLLATVSGTALVAVKWFYDTYLPFLNIGLLDAHPSILVQGMGAFLITDLMFYVSHRIRHKVKWLWHFHAVHHSQREMNPLTTNRGHFVEGIVNTVVRTLPIAIVGGSYPTWFLFGVLNNFWGYFIHSNLKVHLGVFGRFIVTPQYHRVHHSIEEPHWDKNFGERLTLWDHLFRTAYSNLEEYPPTGVPDPVPVETSRTPWGLAKSWFWLNVYPFQAIWRSL